MQILMGNVKMENKANTDRVGIGYDNQKQNHSSPLHVLLCLSYVSSSYHDLFFFLKDPKNHKCCEKILIYAV